ncbi:MAG: hypothetical protein BHW59_03660 [Desulfovibrio piger]|nr:MAG: hypothetical protein BHW59_03660 [Desulfovibrio piger]
MNPAVDGKSVRKVLKIRMIFKSLIKRRIRIINKRIRLAIIDDAGRHGHLAITDSGTVLIFYRVPYTIIIVLKRCKCAIGKICLLSSLGIPGRDRDLRRIVQHVHGHGRAYFHARGIVRQIQIERRLVGQALIGISGVSMSIVALKRIGQLAVPVCQQPLAVVDGKGQDSVFSGNPAVRVQRIAFGQRDRLRDHAGIRHRTVCQTAFVHLYGLARYRNVSAARQIDLDLDRRTRRVAISVLCREREVTIRDLRGGSGPAWRLQEYTYS